MNPETEEKIYFYTEDLQVGYGGKQILNPCLLYTSDAADE